MREAPYCRLELSFLGVTAGRILVRFLFILFLVLGWVPLRASACVARDFLNLPLPMQTSEQVWMTATLMAYPALRPGADGETLIAPDGQTVSVSGMTGRSPREIILAPSFGDQFFAIYPLDRDLETRLMRVRFCRASASFGICANSL